MITLLAIEGFSISKYVFYENLICGRDRKMPKRRYKTQWHRYCTVIGVLIVAVGGLFMIIIGVDALFREVVPDTHFLVNFINLDNDLAFLFSLVTIVCGIAILVATVHQKPHSEDTVIWILLSAILAVIGGTLGGLIVFGGALIYAIFYFI